MTEGRNRIEIPVNKIRKISPRRDREGKVIELEGTQFILAVVELKEGNSRMLYISNVSQSITGSDSWGKHSFDMRNLATVEIG